MPREVTWVGSAPDKCDLCEAPIGTTFFDAQTRHRVWACLCETCFHTDGIGLGTGRGQKYDRQPDGQYVKVAG